MQAGLGTEDLARAMRRLLEKQGLERDDVIQFATLLLDAVIREVRADEAAATAGR